MPLFADGDNFWVVKTVIDLISVIGLFLTLFSIWLAWWLAKRDLKSRVAEAVSEAVTRLVSGLVQNDVIETLRYLEQVREACRVKDWLRAIDRCEQAMRRIPKFYSLPGIEQTDRERLDEGVDHLRLMIRHLEQIRDPDKKPKEFSAEKSNQLDNLITRVSRIEGTLRAAALR